MSGQEDISTDKIRDSVELTKELVSIEQDSIPPAETESTDAEKQPSPKEDLGQSLSGLSPAELILVERSQDSLQVTKKRMARGRGQRDGHSVDSDASCETSESTRVVCPTVDQKKKKIKTRFFIGGHVSVPSSAGERKSVGRRISEALGLRNAKEGEQSVEDGVEDTARGPSSEGHVTFQKFPEVID